MVEPTPLHPAVLKDAPHPAKPLEPAQIADGKAAGPTAAASVGPQFDNRGKVLRPAFPRKRKGEPRLNAVGRPGPRLNAAERAFLPAALEVVETPASPALRWTALSICTLFAAAITWAAVSDIDMVAVAQGKVVPLGQVKVVQPLETAMIRAIYVDEGDHVVAGQLLVDLDPTEAQADLGTLRYNLFQAELDAEVARVLLTRDPATRFVAPAGSDPELVAGNWMQAKREIERHLAALAELDAERGQKQASLESNAAQIERLSTILPLLEEKLTTATGLWDKRYGARPAVLDAAQEVAEKRGDLKAARSNVRQIEAEMRALDAKRDEARAAFLADAGDRRTKALQKIAGLDQEITKVRQKESYRRLVAPVDGTVQGVKVHTPGAVVTTADVLMTVVPDGAGIEVEAQVGNGDIGFVREGQAVEVKLDAFPFTRYGLIKGHVRKLGRDAVQTGQVAGANGAPAQQSAAGVAAPAGTAELSYPAKITLDRDWIGVGGHREAVQAGMRVTAEIRTGDRKVLDYLLSPVMQAVKEAGRER